MLYGNEQKNLTATRLKKLREDRNLSHEKLKYQLDKMYYEDKDSGEIRRRIEIDMKEDVDEYPSIISLSTLKNYEVHFFEGVKGSRAKAGFGMKISYITMFADFYDVSVEYLLGLAEISSTDNADKLINEKTGLSDIAILNLKFQRISPVGNTATLNKLLENHDFHNIVHNIHLLKVEAINKLLFEMETQMDDDGKNRAYHFKEYRNIIYGNPITLNPYDYYYFHENQLKEEFIDFVRRFINSSLEDKDNNNLLEEKSQLIKIWENPPDFSEIRKKVWS